jgi:hypothetical protein
MNCHRCVLIQNISRLAFHALTFSTQRRDGREGAKDLARPLGDFALLCGFALIASDIAQVATVEFSRFGFGTVALGILFYFLSCSRFAQSTNANSLELRSAWA